MKKLLKHLTILAMMTAFANAESFSHSKKILMDEIYADHMESFYCKNPYEVKKIKNKNKAVILQDKKLYSPRNTHTKKGKINWRSRFIEWEHVMPAHNFGRHLTCWRKGGRKECSKDELFRKMEADMYNLVPAIGEVNGDRSNFRYGAKPPRKGQYGECPMEVDFKSRRAYISTDLRGDVARMYFYMSERYNINLSKQERRMMEVWDAEDPVDEWEKTKNKRVYKMQGNYNRFIEVLD